MVIGNVVRGNGTGFGSQRHSVASLLVVFALWRGMKCPVEQEMAASLLNFRFLTHCSFRLADVAFFHPPGPCNEIVVIHNEEMACGSLLAVCRAFYFLLESFWKLLHVRQGTKRG